MKKTNINFGGSEVEISLDIELPVKIVIFFYFYLLLFFLYETFHVKRATKKNFSCQIPIKK